LDFSILYLSVLNFWKFCFAKPASIGSGCIQLFARKCSNAKVGTHRKYSLPTLLPAFLTSKVILFITNTVISMK